MRMRMQRREGVIISHPRLGCGEIGTRRCWYSRLVFPHETQKRQYFTNLCKLLQSSLGKYTKLT